MEASTEHSKDLRPEIKLLIVDDREDNLLSIETILEPEGYTIRKANSGRAALKILLKEYDFTLILMDVQMPDLTGFETANLIYERDKLKHIPIIFITANDYGEENLFKGYQMGGIDYIYKPINPDLLRMKVNVFVELYNKNHQLLAQEQILKTVNQNLEREIQERISSEEQVLSLNKQLIENINQLKSTNEELERFAYIASHDLQEPLRKIIIFGDRLVGKYNNALGEEGIEYLDRMMKATSRMQLLIKNLLSFSRSATDGEQPESINLNTVIEGVLSDLEVQIEQKAAAFHIGKLPVVNAFPGHFRQLFQNLIINSLKFSREEIAPEITISAEMDVDTDINNTNPLLSEPHIKIYVKDNGIGFEQQYADKIFGIFQRLDGNRFQGSGIGLAICKKIVEKHNGYIKAESEPGNGAKFIMLLPKE